MRSRVRIPPGEPGVSYCARDGCCEAARRVVRQPVDSAGIRSHDSVESVGNTPWVVRSLSLTDGVARRASSLTGDAVSVRHSRSRAPSPSVWSGRPGPQIPHSPRAGPAVRSWDGFLVNARRTAYCRGAGFASTNGKEGRASLPVDSTGFAYDDPCKSAGAASTWTVLPRSRASGVAKRDHVGDAGSLGQSGVMWPVQRFGRYFAHEGDEVRVRRARLRWLGAVRAVRVAAERLDAIARRVVLQGDPGSYRALTRRRGRRGARSESPGLVASSGDCRGDHHSAVDRRVCSQLVRSMSVYD